MSGEIPKMISYLLLFLIGTTLMFGLRYTPPYGLPCNVMLKPYDFFSFSPYLPWLLIIFFAVLSVHLLLTRRFLDLNVAIAMVPILIFAVNWPYLIHHNVFSHNISTIEMLRGGRVESISGSHASMWPGFYFTADFLVQVTGLDIGTVNGIATVNVLMLSLFLQLMGVIIYCIVKKIYIFTGNRVIMYSSLFMWIFLFNNRVMYEFMFHHQWYAIVLLCALIYLLLEFEISKRSKIKSHLVISMLVVSFAITITHPITGFMAVLMFLSYSIIRRRAFTVALSSACIYVSWWTFVGVTYIGNALSWVEILLGGGGLITEFVAESFQTSGALPFYDIIAANIYKVYYIVAIVFSLTTLAAILFKRIGDKKVLSVSVVSSCAFLAIIAFAPFGLASVLWEDRVYWHIPLSLAITSTIGFILYMRVPLEKIKALKRHKKKLELLVLPIALGGLISSSFLIFKINYYNLYYTPPSDEELSKWVIMHSDNGTRLAVGQTLRLPDYYAVVYNKDIETSATDFFSLVQHSNSLSELLNPLEKANMILYTCHLEQSLKRGISHLGYSLENETVNCAIDSILAKCNLIYNDGKTEVFYSYNNSTT